MGRRAALLLLGIAAIACRSQSAAPKVISAKGFGVVGDGKTDDGPAIRKAVAAAVKAGPGAELVFEKRTYRLGMHEGAANISLSDVTDLAIDGKGSLLLVHPRNGVFDVRRCRNVTIRGFAIDFSPLPFTQGTIRSVDAKEGVLDLEIHPGYPLPLSDAAVKKHLGARGWQWGTVIDPKERHRRWDVSDHFHLDSVDRIAGRLYRVKTIASYAKRLAPVRPGDRFFLPLMLVGKGVPGRGSNITIRESADCTIEDITIHTARSGMNYAVVRNEGRITLRNNRIMFRPGSTHVCTTWKDGVHCKDNRVGPLIEGCYFEGMLDDSINISANTAMAARITSPTEFDLVGPAFSVGDKVMVFDPRSGKIMAETEVVRARGRTVVLADPVEGVVAGRKRSHVDIKATHFYNMSYVNDGFIVRDCTFKPQRRHALLVRSSKGIFEGNTVNGVGGAAVWMGNEMGSFYEGPFPQNNVIRNNRIRNTQQPAIHIYTSKLGGSARHTRNIRVENNTITVLPGKQGIFVRHSENVVLKANRILDADGRELGKAGVVISNSREVRVE